MILDTKAIKERMVLQSAFNELRKVAAYMDAGTNENIRFFEPKPVNVIRYYTDARYLFNRICDIAGFTAKEIREENNKGRIKALIWSILSSFGHRQAQINPLFGLSRSTGGMVQFYRERLKQQMRTEPSLLFLYENINRVLEQDMEEVSMKND